MKININDEIKVRLTSYGEKIHFDYYFKILQYTRPLKECLPKEDEDGYTTYTLWKFTHIFGNHLWNGSKQVIKDNEIVLLSKDKEKTSEEKEDINRLITAWGVFYDSNPYELCEGNRFRALQNPDYFIGDMIKDTVRLLKERKKDND